MANNDIEKAEKYAQRLLRVRQRSENELNTRLGRKGFDNRTIANLIDQFKEKGLLDDVKFARSWVNSRMKLNPKGALALRHELIEKGISKENIDLVIPKNVEFEEETVKRLVSEKAKQLKGLPKTKAKKRLYDYLARRGFKYEVIDTVIGKTIDIDEK
ncbi:MAG: regulatory protein RecX [Candidatus Omnitrophica bacterium]|nr:regulatory protein RecX [Candidatus Omnitrophota bacterium]